MTDDRTKRPGEGEDPVPRDLPDQQTQEGGDRWDITPADPAKRDGSVDDEASESDSGIPDTDEAGTGRRGDEHSGSVHPEDPGPEESPD